MSVAASVSAPRASFNSIPGSTAGGPSPSGRPRWRSTSTFNSTPAIRRGTQLVELLDGLDVPFNSTPAVRRGTPSGRDPSAPAPRAFNSTPAVRRGTQHFVVLADAAGAPSISTPAVTPGDTPRAGSRPPRPRSFNSTPAVRRGTRWEWLAAVQASMPSIPPRQYAGGHRCLSGSPLYKHYDAPSIPPRQIRRGTPQSGSPSGTPRTRCPFNSTPADTPGDTSMRTNVLPGSRWWSFNSTPGSTPGDTALPARPVLASSPVTDASALRFVHQEHLQSGEFAPRCRFTTSPLARGQQSQSPTDTGAQQQRARNGGSELDRHVRAGIPGQVDRDPGQPDVLSARNAAHRIETHGRDRLLGNTRESQQAPGRPFRTRLSPSVVQARQDHGRRRRPIRRTLGVPACYVVLYRFQDDRPLRSACPSTLAPVANRIRFQFPPG